MFGLTALEIRALAIVALIAAGVAGAAWIYAKGSEHGALACQAARSQDAATTAQDLAKATVQLHQRDTAAQAQLQAWQVAQRPKQAKAAKEVHDALQADPTGCASVALPPRVLSALRSATAAASAASAAQPVPDGAVP